MSLTLADRVAAYLDGHTTLNLATTGPAGLWPETRHRAQARSGPRWAPLCRPGPGQRVRQARGCVGS